MRWSKTLLSPIRDVRNGREMVAVLTAKREVNDIKMARECEPFCLVCSVKITLQLRQERCT